MAYIWENYSADKIFVSGKNICPYIEVFCNSEKRTEVNPLIRFSELFELLHADELKEIITDMEPCENILYHFLAQLDMCKGLSYKQRIIESTKKEIIAGYYGNKVKSLWMNLNEDDKETVLYVLTERLLDDKSNYFMSAINKLFILSSLCYEEKTDTYYLYIGESKTEYNVAKYELLLVLFWTIKKKIVPIWQNHYGIVGINDSMKIELIQIV